MSGTKSKKALKKAEKEKREKFKKAFKKQTGVDTDSSDWGKILEAFSAQVKELVKWASILVKNQPEERESTEPSLIYWTNKSAQLQKDARRDKTAAGTEARTQLQLLLRILEGVRKKAKAKPVKETVGEQEVSVYITDIPGYADLSSNEREAAVKEAARKTARGLELFDRIASGDLDLDDPGHATSQDDAEALIWALKSKAQQKLGGPYQKGAMTVPNGENLRKFLDKCPEVYSRLSSHLREQQGRNVKGGTKPGSLEGQTPRGMDFYNPDGDDKPGRLPAGMNALLFQQVVLPNGEKALYVKMETEGSFGHPGDNRKLDPTVPPDRAKHPNDGQRALKHFKNLIIKEKGGEDGDLQGLREQTPKDIVAAAKAVVKAATGKKAKTCLKGSFGTEPKWLLFKTAVPRISLFLAAVEDCRRYRDGGLDGWELGTDAEDELDRMILLMQSKFPADLLESDRRMGEEVVLTEADMQTADGNDMMDQEDEADEGDDEDDTDEDVLDISELSLRCYDLVDAVVDPDLKARLEKIYYEQVLERATPEAFRRFEGVAGKSTQAELGPRAARVYDKLSPMIERL